MEDHSEKAKPLRRKRSRRPKGLDFVGWGSKNLIRFLESLGRDTTDKISEYDVIYIVRKYIQELNVTSQSHPPNKKKKTKIVPCDEKLSLLFGCTKINMTKLPDLVAKHYVENQEDDEEFNYLYSSEGDDDDDKKQRLVLLDKEVVVKRPKGSIAAIVRDNVKLVYLRKSLVEELAKTAETFEGKVMGSFVRIKNPCQLKNPWQLVQVTGVKEWNPIDGHFLQVTNYCYYLEDVASSALSDDDFTQEECEELNQRMKNGSVKRLTVMEMEEKVRSLHEDVTKHWIARELESLKMKISRASEKGWKRELSQYLDRRELLNNPEERSKLLLEVPEVIAEELEPERVDVDVNIEDDNMEPNQQELKDSPEVVAEELEPEGVDIDVKVEDDFMETNPEASFETPKLGDEEDQPTRAASGGDKDLLEGVEKQLEDVIITQNKKDSTYVQPQAQPNPPEIIELSDDDDEEDNDDAVYKKCDPKKKMWCYELPKGQTNGPYSLEDFKRWSEQEYFVDVPDFKVFMTGNSIESGVLLTKLLPHIKS